MSLSIFRNRNYFLLWTGQLISNIGNAIYFIILPWMILDLTGSKFSTSIVITCSYLPAIVFGLSAGIIIDKYSKKRIIIYSDFIRAILIMFIPLSMILDLISPFLIGLITFCISGVSTFCYPARDSIIPLIVKKDELSIANSLISISVQISQLLGPLLASLFISIIGMIHLFSINAVSFLFSMLLISFTIVPFRSNYKDKKIEFNNFIDSFSFLKNNKSIMYLLLLTSVNNFFIMGPAYIGIPVFVREILIEDFSVYARIEAIMAGGMIIGSLFYLVISKILRSIFILRLGILFDGVTFALLYYSQSIFSMAFIIFFHGIAIPFIIVSRTTIIQKIIPNKYLGRVFSMVHISVMGMAAISIIFTGLFLEFINIKIMFLIIGICAALSILISFHHSIKNL